LEINRSESFVKLLNEDNYNYYSTADLQGSSGLTGSANIPTDSLSAGTYRLEFYVKPTKGNIAKALTSPRLKLEFPQVEIVCAPRFVCSGEPLHLKAKTIPENICCSLYWFIDEKPQGANASAGDGVFQGDTVGEYTVGVTICGDKVTGVDFDYATVKVIEEDEFYGCGNTLELWCIFHPIYCYRGVNYTCSLSDKEGLEDVTEDAAYRYLRNENDVRQHGWPECMINPILHKMLSCLAYNIFDKDFSVTVQFLEAVECEEIIFYLIMQTAPTCHF